MALDQHLLELVHTGKIKVSEAMKFSENQAFLATKAVYELHRTGGKYALVTMCIGGGQGIALAIERA